MKKILALIIFATSMNTFCYTNSFNIEKVLRVYDGDTFAVDLHCPGNKNKKIKHLICKNIRIRPTGFNAPEINSSDVDVKISAFASRDYLRTVISESSKIKLKNVKRGKYFRLVADVYIDNVPLSLIMIESGHAVPFDK